MSKITLPVAELKPALTGFGKIISRRITLPVLGALRIERTSQGWITVTGTENFLMAASLAEGETILENAAQELSKSQNQPMDDVFLNRMWDDTEATTSSVMPGEGFWKALTKAQLDARRLWFANLNTPEEFLEAEQRVDALDT